MDVAGGSAGRVPHRHSIATVALGGTLGEKLAAASAAGFDGVELFEPDLIAAPLAPEEVRRRLADLGLVSSSTSRCATSRRVPPELFRRKLRLVRAKFDLMRRLGARMALLCSNVSPQAVDDDDLAAEQLSAVADEARARGLTVAYEALAWGTHVSEYVHAWRIVRRAAHPALGICLDSFHILARGHQPGRDRRDPARQAVHAPARRRAAAADGRAAVEQALPLLPRAGRLRPGVVPRAGCSRRATTGRCPWRSSTTSSGRRTRSARRSTAAGRCCGWRSASAAGHENRRAQGRAQPGIRQPGACRRQRPPRFRVHRAQRAAGDRSGGLERLLTGLGLRRTGPAPEQARRAVGGRRGADPGEQRPPLRARPGTLRRGRRRPRRQRRAEPIAERATALRAPLVPRHRNWDEADLVGHRGARRRGDPPLRGRQCLARRLRPVRRRPSVQRQDPAHGHRSCRSGAAADAVP